MSIQMKPSWVASRTEATVRSHLSFHHKCKRSFHSSSSFASVNRWGKVWRLATLFSSERLSSIMACVMTLNTLHIIFHKSHQRDHDLNNFFNVHMFMNAGTVSKKEGRQGCPFSNVYLFFLLNRKATPRCFTFSVVEPSSRPTRTVRSTNSAIRGSATFRESCTRSVTSTCQSGPSMVMTWWVPSVEVVWNWVSTLTTARWNCRVQPRLTRLSSSSSSVSLSRVLLRGKEEK